MSGLPPDSERYAWPPPVVLTEGQMEDIAERAAEKAVVKMEKNLYAGFGAAVLRKGLYVVGVAFALLTAWLAGKGHL